MGSEDEILGCKTIAVVGLSREPAKDSYKVASYLKENGCRIVPVNPFAGEILGEKCHKSLSEIPEALAREIDMVDIFRPASDVSPIVDDAIGLRKKYGKLKVVWMQLGIVNEEAAKKARDAGLVVIMGKCAMIEHKRLVHGGAEI